MKNTKIVSAFPGTGKSWMFNNQEELKLSILDSDSSNFSWISPGVREPNFPNNYIQHIKENMGKVDIILVSSHDIVRKSLCENKLEYTLVYPFKNCKEEYIGRFINRGNNDKFVEFISSNWNGFIDDMTNESFPTKVQLGSG